MIRAIALWCAWLATAWTVACVPSAEPTGEAIVADAAVEQELEGASRVATGADVLARDGFGALRGLRVGLLTNATGRVGDRHLADLLAESPDVELMRLFAPEHGIRGESEAGELVADGLDAATGVPVISLYGSAKAPPANALTDLDILVFDVQDVGARFYTYIATMGLAMQESARQGIPFLVLDRPNPLGGVRVEGFVGSSSERALRRPSLVDFYPIPILHGLTVAEMAQMIRGEHWLADLEDLDLRVITMQGWSRSQLWTDTGLEWTPPSPNLPSPETAMVYPGSCLFEGTQWSEGRGTEAPFLTVGATGARSGALLRDLDAAGLPGIRFEALEFVPRSLPGRASRPKGEGEVHAGVRLRVVDARRLEPVRTGVALLRAFLDQAALAQTTSPQTTSPQATSPERVADNPPLRADWLDRLVGSDRLRNLLLEGRSAEEIARAWRPDVEAFEKLRQPYLLYP